MGNFISFAELIEKKIRSQIEGPTEKPLESATLGLYDDLPLSFAFLLGASPKAAHTLDRTKAARRAYRIIEKDLPPHRLTPSETLAKSFFESWSCSLSPRFSKSELKTKWRELAKKTHPDQGGSSVLFLEAQEAYRILTQFVLKKPA